MPPATNRPLPNAREMNGRPFFVRVVFPDEAVGRGDQPPIAADAEEAVVAKGELLHHGMLAAVAGQAILIGGGPFLAVGGVGKTGNVAAAAMGDEAVLAPAMQRKGPESRT